MIGQIIHDLLLVELFDVKYYCDLEIWVRGHSRSFSESNYWYNVCTDSTRHEAAHSQLKSSQVKSSSLLISTSGAHCYVMKDEKDKNR